MVYFCVDRLRRNLAIREKVSTGTILPVIFLVLFSLFRPVSENSFSGFPVIASLKLVFWIIIPYFIDHLFSSAYGCAPVVEDTEHLKLVGVVTERDVCCGVAADDRRASDVRVETIMRPLSACCVASEPVEEARRKLHEHRATSLPVVNKAGCCCGTVSVHQLGKS